MSISSVRTFTRLSVVALGLCIASDLRAQVDMKNPDAVAQAYAQASRRADWPAVAALVHPEVLKQLKTTFREIVVSDTAHEIAPAVFRLSTVGAYDALPPAEIFVRLMNAFVSGTPGFKEAMAAAEFEGVGHVNEGATLSHVVYRLAVKMGGSTVKRIQVMSLRKDGAEWKAELSEELEGFASALTGKPPK